MTFRMVEKTQESTSKSLKGTPRSPVIPKHPSLRNEELEMKSIVKAMIIMFFVCFLWVFVFLPFLGPLPWHMEIPRLGVKSEL